jgi:hypothetical protein
VWRSKLRDPGSPALRPTFRVRLIGKLVGAGLGV